MSVMWELHEYFNVRMMFHQIASPGLMHETGCSGLVHWDDPEGKDGERDGRAVQDGEHMYTHGWFMSMYGKTHYNIVIILQLK